MRRPERAANALLSTDLGGSAKCAPAGARVVVVVLVMACNVGIVLVLVSLLMHSLGLKLREKLRAKVPCAARAFQADSGGGGRRGERRWH